MNIKSNETYNNLMNTSPCNDFHENIQFRFCFASMFFICYSVCFYGVLSFLSRYIKIHSKLSKAIIFIKSILAGLIFSLFFDDRLANKVGLEKFSIFQNSILNNLPFLTMEGTFILVSLGVLIYRAKTYKPSQNDDLSNDCENSLSAMEVDNKKTNTFNYFFDNIKKMILGIAEEYNTNFYPFIYLSVLFFHSFFSGLGFSGQQYIGLSEIIILMHKVYEMYSIQQIFKKLRFSSSRSLYLMFFFNILTSIGILIRGYLIFYNVSVDKMLTSKLCHRMFAMSFFIMAVIEAFIPMPQTWLDILLYLPITYFSYKYFNLYFNNNDPVF